ncbi:hypothetical protein K488DRAFT_56508 [Vararia minispora EC-137]|uniref:Uncharacterized protein n=1 Tax=Vararia minispora EC-137 TaxID=1314806 RepID=A0ACB8QCS8_9AGAM|nr:hypothetical protein K488DRAFT_56508 [Vararia minispora EC-137]
MGDVSKLAGPQSLTTSQLDNIFQHIFRRLAASRHTFELYAISELSLSLLAPERSQAVHDDFIYEIDAWAQSLLAAVWGACGEPGGGTSVRECPQIDPLSDTSMRGLEPLPPSTTLEKMINMTLFLHIMSTRQYSPRTRTFLAGFVPLDEDNIVATLRNPDSAMQNADARVTAERSRHAGRRAFFRKAGVGLGAVAGGVLVGVTGGLAAPLVGAGVGALFGALGVGGTAVGLVATGLASSSIVCGALFGAYGAGSTASMIRRHIREVRDLSVVPVRPPKESLALRLCVTGWLSSREDVVAPWTVFEGDDTFSLQWEVEALQTLSNALFSLVKEHAIKYLKKEIIQRTVLSSLMSALSPVALLQIGRVIDNPWMNARALALKTGAVLADLLASRAFGTRPITLTGYSLGALVIFEALRLLSQRPPTETAHLIQDVFLLGAPVKPNMRTWAAVRRVVAGRLVNCYGSNDYVLAVLCRASDATWSVAGISPVEVQGVENFEISGVDGHLKWRGMIGSALLASGATDVNMAEVERQRKIAEKIAEETDVDSTGADLPLRGEETAMPQHYTAMEKDQHTAAD